MIEILMLTALLAGAAPQAGDCRSDDLVCRLDELERRVRRMEREDRTPPPPREPRSIDIPVYSTCSDMGCANVAAQHCRTAGFPRGAPAEMRTEYGVTAMVRITCMD